MPDYDRMMRAASTQSEPAKIAAMPPEHAAMPPKSAALRARVPHALVDQPRTGKGLAAFLADWSRPSHATA